MIETNLILYVIIIYALIVSLFIILLVIELYGIGHTNIIHPSFQHGINFKIGKYNVINKGVLVGDNITIRNYVELREGTIIGNDCYLDSGVSFSGKCQIGNRVTIRYKAIIARNVIIEDDVFISPQVMFINIPFTDKEKGNTIIHKGVKIGTNATINNGVEICEGVIIGAKALVTKSIFESGIYIGIPAKKIKEIEVNENTS